MKTDVAVIGGGPAGAAVAAQLAAGGRDVVVVEREAAPKEKVCGDFLSVEAQHYAGALGIDLRALGAVPLHTVRLIAGTAIAGSELPFPGLSLSRYALDEAILRVAEAQGAHILRGRRCTALSASDRMACLSLDGGASVEARNVVLATGKHDLRGWLRPPGKQNDLIAFKMHFRLTEEAARALDGAVELFLFSGGYAGLQPIEHGRANLCLVIRAARYAALGRHWDAVLDVMCRESPLFAERLDGAAADWGKPLSIARIPYGLITRPRPSNGVWRIGDQAAVIPSFSGDGISIALHSASIAATMLAREEPAANFQSRLAADLRRPVRDATLLSRLMVHGAMQPVLARAARLNPEWMAAIARRTRVPGWAMAGNTA